MNNKLISGIFFLILSTSFLASGGSVYSRYGAGDVYYLHSARKMAMGTPGLALIGSNESENLNPASWSGIQMTRIQTGMLYKGTSMDGGNSSAYYSDYQFTGFMIGLPVQRDYGISFVAGLVPYTNINYEIVNDVNEEYSLNYEGDGGLSKLFLGGSYTTPIGISIGAAFEYYTGKTDYLSEIDYISTSNRGDATFLNKSSFYGSGFRVGILSQDLSQYFESSSITDIRIGGYYSYIGKINTDTTLTINSKVGTSSLADGLIETKFPFSFGAGAQIQFHNAYLIALDFVYEPWSEYAVNHIKDNNMQDVTRLSAGFEYKKPDAQYGSFWEQIAFRCGLSYETLKYTIAGEDLDQFSVHGGFSLPLSAANDLDFGFSYGMRGTNSSGLVKENLYNFVITLNFGELWFVRQDR